MFAESEIFTNFTTVNIGLSDYISDGGMRAAGL